MNEKDPFGNACLAYLNGLRGEEIDVFCNVTEADIIPVDYLFRGYEEMPLIEQTALKYCKGRTLVIGAGSGCHSLYLQDKGLDVTSIDISAGAVKTMKQFGLKQVLLQDIYTYQPDEKFDTILTLMNGLGIAGDLANLPLFLNKCMGLLLPKGELIVDSTDLNYLIKGEELEYNLTHNYIGELEYQMVYGHAETDWFKWLYIDSGLLASITEREGFLMNVLLEDKDYNYLARIIRKDK